MKETLINKEYNYNFLLEEGKLRKIVELIELYAKKKGFETQIQYIIERQDNSEYKFSSIENILNDVNAEGKKIENLKLELTKIDKEHTWKNESICTVEFNTKSKYSYFSQSSIKFNLKDEDRNWSLPFSEDLDVYIQRIILNKSKQSNIVLILLDGFIVYFAFAIIIWVVIIGFIVSFIAGISATLLLR